MNWTSSKLKFWFSKDTTIKKMKSLKPHTRRKIFIKYMSDKGFVSRKYIKDFENSVIIRQQPDLNVCKRFG